VANTVTAAEASALVLPVRAVDVEDIERELHGILFEPSETAETPAEVAIRARMSNLLVWIDDPNDAARLENDVGGVAELHPSRILVMVGGVGAGSDLTAYVSAICQIGEGGRRLCSEHVVLRAGRGAAHRLPSVARALLVGDLPTSLWWTSATLPPAGMGVADELLAMAGQMIFDSATCSAAYAGLPAVGAWVASLGKRTVADLAWSRTEPWRGLLIRALDPRCAPAALAGLRAVRIEHGAQATTEALLLLGWLASRLGWRVAGERPDGADGADRRRWVATGPAGEIALEARRDPAGRAGIVRSHFGWQEPSGRAGSLDVVAVDGGRLATSASDGGLERIVAAPQARLPALVAGRLADLTVDRVYLEALTLGSALGRG
jgi:glucose-6-phosphate dehydrogenase assembly protein OpcA